MSSGNVDRREYCIFFKMGWWGVVIEGDPNQSLRDITGEIPCLAMLSRVSGYLVETRSDHTERELVATYLMWWSKGPWSTVLPQAVKIPGVPLSKSNHGLQKAQLMCKYFTWERCHSNLLIPHLAWIRWANCTVPWEMAQCKRRCWRWVEDPAWVGGEAGDWQVIGQCEEPEPGLVEVSGSWHSTL